VSQPYLTSVVEGAVASSDNTEEGGAAFLTKQLRVAKSVSTVFLERSKFSLSVGWI
jgi:hypothetical protein